MKFPFAKNIIGTLMFMCIFVVVHQMYDPDFGWHLREGERILDGGAINSPD